jgi:S-adenosylmethionine:tRNA ribosyltransferase-isomerase
MKVTDFSFDLPESSIALRPLPRGTARQLLISSDGALGDDLVENLPNHLKDGDVLVLNDTKVIPAALKAIRPARAHGGGQDLTVTLNLHKQESDNQWAAFARPVKRLKVGDSVHCSDALSATVTEIRNGGDISLSFNRSGEDLQALINSVGEMPLPPYISKKRKVEASDTEDYQTVFANEAGSVAAPTAGLHFTPNLLERLKNKGVRIEYLTLHVGAGTFLPVKSDDTDEHIMHYEWFDLPEDVAERINFARWSGGRVIAVGTTALRALEASAKNGQIQAFQGETDIFITPGYEFQIVDGLMTNFHLPKSTLFMLVSALAGLDTMQRAYAHAIKHDYRFYSYGDSSLIWKAE